MLALANGRDLVTAYLGTLKAGAVDRSRAGSRVLFPDPRAQSIDDTHLAAIIYTSGSTGTPRGVMLSHRNSSRTPRPSSTTWLTAVDRVMCVLPFYYVYGVSLLHTHVAVGGSLVIENRAAFSNVILNSMRHHQVTGLAGVPSTFALMLHRSNLSTIELPSLRYVTQAGGEMPPALIAEWLESGPAADFYVMYGATEAAARLTYLPPADLRRKLGSIARAIPGVQIRVITQQGAVAAAGRLASWWPPTTTSPADTGTIRKRPPGGSPLRLFAPAISATPTGRLSLSRRAQAGHDQGWCPPRRGDLYRKRASRPSSRLRCGGHADGPSAARRGARRLRGVEAAVGDDVAGLRGQESTAGFPGCV